MHLLADIVDEKALAESRVLDPALLHLCPELLYDFIRCGNSDVITDERLFKVLVEVLVNPVVRCKRPFKVAVDVLA